MAELHPRRSSRALLLLLRVLSGRRKGFWTPTNLGELRRLYRLGGVMLVTILLPGLLLAYFGLSSIRGESAQIESEIRASAERATDQAADQSLLLFSDFEEGTRRRLASGRSPLESLAELSPNLLVAFRLDEDGRPAAPFQSAPDALIHYDSLLFSESWRSTLAEESDPEAHLLLVDAAGKQARGSVAVGRSLLAQGRAMHRLGRREEAERVLDRVRTEFAEVRDPLGFRLGDIARLKAAENWLMEDPVRAVEALQDLALDLLEADWTIGRGNEAALAARAIELVEDRASKDWLGRNRGRLEDRTRQLFWAEQLFDELRPLQSEASGLSGESGEVFYRAGRRAHWAGTWWGGDFYAFALDRSGLEADLRALCAQAITGTEHIDMSVVPPTAEPPSLGLARRSLSPFLPSWSLSAHLRNEQAIANLQARRTRQQMAIVLLALFMIITGSVVTARMVGREMEVARVKADFAANVSHELRSPITQIRLKGESLQFGLPADEEELIEHYDVIVQESERLSRLVDNVLDFSAIERGAKRYDLRPADLGETVRAAVETARFTMETRGLDMAFTVPEGLPVVLHDPEAIGQVIQNLISNAAKYGLKGGWIGVSGGVSQRTVDISVSDKGMGISAEDLPQIFHKFYRSSNPLARMQKGTGIGLTIVQYIMNAHGGSVSVKSSEGIGTTFTLHFPIRSPTHSGL